MVTDVSSSFSFLLILGRPVRNMKKFEEGVFSDLRNLKPGHDACLEEPKVSVTSFSGFNTILSFFFILVRFFPYLHSFLPTSVFPLWLSTWQIGYV